uniref:CRIB domain-containing protein n=1 Tax=Panagrolaimus superbus TaxID=310955 RepID=A0A914YCG8_9BILA
MPTHWDVLLQNSKISKQEQQQNPQAVLDALQYYTRPSMTQQKWLNYDSGYGNCIDQLSASPFFQKQGLSSSNGTYSSNSLPHLHHINHHQSSQQQQQQQQQLHHSQQQQQQYQKPQLIQKDSFTRTSGTSSNGSTTTTSKASSNLSDEGIQLPDLISPAKSTSHISSQNNGMHGIKTNGSLSIKDGPLFSRTPASEPSVPSYAPPSVPKEEAPPIIPERPTKTMSIYTKPKEEEVIKDLSNGGFGRNAARAKRRVTDIEVLAKLKTIVTIGNPDRKYHK